MRLTEKLINDFQSTLPVQKIHFSRNINPRKKVSSSKTSVSSLNNTESPGNPGENALWSRFKNGSESAFTLIYNKHIVSLYNYGEIITSNKELIEDSIHDLFVDLWKNKSKLGPTFSIKFYLFKGLKRQIIRGLSLNRRLTTRDFSRDYHIGSIFSHEMTIVSEEISEEQKSSLTRALNKLSHRQKEAIVLRFYDNLSYKEIGDLLSISVKSTYTLIYRSIVVLKLNIGKIYFAGICLENIFT